MAGRHARQAGQPDYRPQHAVLRNHRGHARACHRHHRGRPGRALQTCRPRGRARRALARERPEGPQGLSPPRGGHRGQRLPAPAAAVQVLAPAAGGRAPAARDPGRRRRARLGARRLGHDATAAEEESEALTINMPDEPGKIVPAGERTKDPKDLEEPKKSKEDEEDVEFKQFEISGEDEVGAIAAFRTLKNSNIYQIISDTRRELGSNSAEEEKFDEYLIYNLDLHL